MEGIFIKLLQMSISASWLIVAIMVLRLVLKKAPKNYFCILWGIVAIRLICPFSIESIFGIVPNCTIMQEELQGQNRLEEDKISYNDDDYEKNEIDSSIDYIYVDNDINFEENSSISNSHISLEGENTDNAPVVVSLEVLVSILWIVGIFLLSLYHLFHFTKLRKKIDISLAIEKGVYICDNIRSPFILGMKRPKIYIPSDLSKEQMACVIAHEKTHLKRLDHYWKPLGFLLLIIYWFNPLIWIAYLLFCKDMELACDESVIQKMSRKEKLFYVQTLIFCSNVENRNLVYPLSFGETGIKERVKFMVCYKKPTLKLMVVAGLICATVVACFGTSNSQTQEPTETEPVVEETTETKTELATELFVFEENEDGTYTVAKSTGKKVYDDFVIPSTYNGKAVTKIGAYAFRNETYMRSIKIPSSITTIEKYAFENCEKLEHVEIPFGVKNIGEFAFAYCKNLKNVTMADSVTNIEKQAFYGCISLRELKLSARLTKIEDLTFAACNSLEYVEIPSGVTSIGRNAFLHTRFCLITVPSSVTYIGENAFQSIYNTNVIIWAEAKEQPKGWDEQWCGKNSVIIWDATKHTLVRDEAIEATCTENGCTTGWHCSECNMQFLAQEEIADKGGHAFIDGNTKESSYCMRCKIPVGELEYVQNEDGTYTIVGIGTYLDTRLEIPVFYNGKKVTSIVEGAFEGVESLNSVRVPGAIKYVGKNAFGNIENGEVVISVDATSKPDNWHDEWQGKNAYVVWLMAPYNQ